MGKIEMWGVSFGDELSDAVQIAFRGLQYLDDEGHPLEAAQLRSYVLTFLHLPATVQSDALISMVRAAKEATS
jgi:hypothetical protein